MLPLVSQLIISELILPVTKIIPLLLSPPPELLSPLPEEGKVAHTNTLKTNFKVALKVKIERYSTLTDVFLRA